MTTPARSHKAALAVALASAAAPAQPQDSTAITIYSTLTPGAIPAAAYRPVPGGNGGQAAWGYNNFGYPNTMPGYAVVRQDRSLGLDKGRTTIRFTGVAALIDPTTVMFSSLTDPSGTQVLEQNYQFDLVSRAKLLERFIDKPITLELSLGNGAVKTVTGTLLSADPSGWLVVRTDDGQIQTTASPINIRFPSLPQGLITRPTLVWDVAAATGGDHVVRLTYQTEGMTWWADYNIVFSEGADANSGLLDLNAWVSILNQSGASYDEAKLKLVAGDVHRAPRANAPAPMMEMARRGDGGGAAGFVEKSFFEYHLYTLGRPTTLPDNSTKQIELFEPAIGIPAEKVLLYYGLAEGYRGFFPSVVQDRNYGTEMNTKVDVYLRFRNSKENRLGVPLPSGRIRVSKIDPDDKALEFIGEDTIDHTPKDENVLIKMGSAFDVVGERRQVDFRADYSAQWMEETIEIKVRNHKEEPVKVLVKENLFRWVNWEITKKTHEFEKHDARSVHFPVTVPKDGEVVVTYTVRYSW